MGFVWRGLELLVLIFVGLIKIAYYRIRLGPKWFQEPQGAHVIGLWMRDMTRLFELKIICEGVPAPAPAVLVSNHISWLDIIVIAAQIEATFLSKDQVRKWPLVGALAKGSGTLFIRRHSSCALRETLRTISKRLAQGQRIVLFPEGTTTTGSKVLPFHNALFQAAVKADCVIQPVCIQYWSGGQRCKKAPYEGETVFFKHILRLLKSPGIEVHLNFADAFTVEGRSRVNLANHARDSICGLLKVG